MYRVVSLGLVVVHVEAKPTYCSENELSKEGWNCMCSDHGHVQMVLIGGVHEQIFVLLNIKSMFRGRGFGM